MTVRLSYLALSVLLIPRYLNAADGKVLYERCAACHLSTRLGVRGSFPPLREDIRRLAALEQGRRYLVLVVTGGLNGKIVVEGNEYRGVMPAQSIMSSEEVAAVLNFLVISESSRGNGVEPFTAREVVRYEAELPMMKSGAVAQLHADLSKE